MEKLGKYEILAELGHGAMGVVYQARDPLIGRLVALKTINSSLVDRPDLLERFYQEAQSAGKLQHPNIVTIFELGQEKNTPFIAMEYLDGESLEKAIVRQGELPLALKVGYIVRICQALEYAHKNRVVHRDIKPGNIMVNSEGVVKVVDFGIARLVDFSRTHTNMMIGTPAYMAPELFRKKKADERTDIWAVGITFYELLCYQRPFTGEGYDIIRAIMEDEFPPASSVAPECGPELEAIIQSMLRKQSTERYQSMEDVLLDLEPVWNQMRFSAAAELTEKARAFFEQGDLPRAHDTLHRARQIDNTSALAKTLFEKISAELRRTEIQPKVQKHLSRGRSFLQAGQFREAQAEVEAALALDSRHELAHKMADEVEAGTARAEKLEREQIQREVQQRIQEIRSKIRREELTDAIDLAKHTLATLGPDTDVTQLLNAAEVESSERNKKKVEADRQLAAARTLLEKEDFAGAKQILDRAIANRVVPTDDVQVRMLLAQIAEREEVLRKSAPKKAPLMPTVPAGSVPAMPGTTVGQSATSMGAGGSRAAGQKPSVPVLTPPPAMPPAHAPAIQTQVHTEERKPGVATKPAPGSVPKKLAVAAAGVVILIGGIYAGARFLRRAPERPPAEDAALEAEAKQLWDNHKMDDALADWKTLASHPGLLQAEAAQQVSQIEQQHVAVEQLYAQGMKLLYEEKKYPEAAAKFNEVLQMNLWKMDETRRELDIATKGAAAETTGNAGGAPRTVEAPPAKPQWQVLFDQGRQAFGKKDYAAAQQYFEDANRTDGVTKDVREQAQRLIAVSRDRDEQKKSLARAVELEQAGQKQQARDMFERVVAAPNGDPSLVAAAKVQIVQIGAISQPPPPVDYQPALAEVRGLIGQSRWDDADAKLNGVPATVAGYNDLKQQIETGRRVAAEFLRVEDAFLQAEASKNKAALRNLRQYFVVQANKAGAMGGDARNIVNRIDTDLREPEGSATAERGSADGGAPHLGDLGGVKAALDNYAKAVDNGDMYALKAVMQVNPNDESRLTELLHSVRGNGYVLQNCSMPEISGQSAKVSCDAMMTKVPNSKKQRTKFQLAMVNGRWMVVASR